MMKKIDRNSPCTCGSGKKYKQCCEPYEKVQAARARPVDPSIPKAIQTALEHHQAGRLSQAEAIFQQILQAEPDHADALHFLGVIAFQSGKKEIAVELISKAIRANPTSLMYYNLGLVLRAQGRLDAAVESYRKALSLKPDYVEAHNNLGNVLKDQGKLDEAVKHYRQALLIKPDDAGAYNNLGSVLKEQGKLEVAIQHYRKALSIRPDYVEAYNTMGNALRDQGNFDAAIESYRKALSLKPNLAEVHNNLGYALKEQGKPDAAIESFRQALALKPDYAEAYNNMGTVFQAQGKLDEAFASYHKAITLKPDFAVAHSSLLYTINFSTSYSTSHRLEEARHYGRNAAGKVSARFSAWSCSANPERLRVGVVSGDLRNHPVGYFLEGMLASIDPARLELIAYAAHHEEDDLTARIRPRFADWKPLPGLADETAARLIHDDGVHILLDLSGHTTFNRLPVFAWKPAPVQASWMGYFATTGLAEMDYLLADPYVTPQDEEDHFTESVWRLPESYLCFTPPDMALEVSPLPALSAGRITFGCFNNLVKMNDAVVALWARVLQAVPGSRLFLKTKQLSDPAICETTRQRFAACSIAPERLLLEGASPRAELLAAYNQVDIALDPFPYPGGTTSVEGLWMGVPVITRRGDRFLSRVGESIAHNAGLADWIAIDDEDYVAKAVAHASGLERLAQLRAGLRQRVLASPVFDAPRFARNFEAAMWGMWQRWQEQQGKQP